MARAARELLAGVGEVWAFLAEPNHLADWWPGVVAVQPDRRGFAVGARWSVQRRESALGPLRLPSSGGGGRARAETLLIDGLEPERRLAFRLLGASARAGFGGPLAATVELAPVGPGRTRATISVERGRLSARRDAATAQRAADRLYELVQTAASL